MNVSIGPRWERFVESVVKTGATVRPARSCAKACASSKSAKRS